MISIVQPSRTIASRTAPTAGFRNLVDIGTHLVPVRCIVDVQFRQSLLDRCDAAEAHSRSATIAQVQAVKERNRVEQQLSILQAEKAAFDESLRKMQVAQLLDDAP